MYALTIRSQVFRAANNGEDMSSGNGEVTRDNLSRRTVDPPKPTDQSQVAGDHYVKLAVQPWHAMEAWQSKEAFAGFLQGNVIKYIARYKSKNGAEDLLKARHYLAKLIEVESSR